MRIGSATDGGNITYKTTMAASIVRCFGSTCRRLYLKQLTSNVSFSARRCLLSEAYRCESAWEERLESPVLDKIVFSEFAIQLKEKLDKDKCASRIDMDIFANKLHEMDTSDAEYVEDIIKRFRVSQDAVPVSDSIVHAIVRAYIQLGMTDRLLVMMKDRVNYGIFPDYYATNILLDHFIKEKNFADAVKVAYEMMLQEDLDHPITHLLCLYVSVKHLLEAKVDERRVEDIPEDTSEEDWIPVGYIRHPCYDDHFDVKDERFLLGKTLNLLGGYAHKDVVLGNTLQLIGLGLWHKFSRGLFLMEELAKSGDKQRILNEALVRFDRCLENAEVKDPKNEKKEQGLLTMDDEIYDLRLTPEAREELTTECEEIWYKLRWNEQVIETGDTLIDRVEQLVKEEINKYEADDIANQRLLFKEWTEERVQMLEEQIKKFMKQQKEREIEGKLQELQDKEELLRYFELRDKIVLAKSKAPKIKPPKPEDDEESLRAKRIKRRKYRHNI